MMTDVRPLLFKPHMLKGLSPRLLISHYENNYGGALRRLNAIDTRLRSLDWATAPVFDINGIKREELIAAGSVILHEIYFDGLGEEGGDPPAGLGLAEALERDFGSVAAWTQEFSAMAKAQAGGSGWTALVWSDRLGRLINQWAADHTHALAGGAPILAIDMYEHAYHLDFGARAVAYVDAVMGNLHWERIAARYRRAGSRRAGRRRPVHAVRFAVGARACDLGRRRCASDLQRDPPALVDVCIARRFAAPHRHAAGRDHAQSGRH